MVSEHTGMIMFDNMMEKAQKNGISLNYERLVSNGGLMLAAGRVLLRLQGSPDDQGTDVSDVE